MLSAGAALARYPRPVTVVGVGLLFTIPAAGFAAYAAVPGRLPDLTRPFWLASIAVLAAIVAAVWVGLRLIAHRRAVPLQSPVLLTTGLLVTSASIVLALSDLVSLWQLPFALANLAINAVWLAIWLPARFRTLEVPTSIEVAVQRSNVFAFMATPGNWPMYQERTEQVKVRPEGTLAVGSEIVTQRSDAAGPFEVVYVVMEFDAGVTFTTSMPYQWPNRQTFRFLDSASGTRIDVLAWELIPYRMAALGWMVEIWSSWSSRLAVARSTLARLKQVLEESQQAC